jgi:hypothetical protein
VNRRDNMTESLPGADRASFAVSQHELQPSDDKDRCQCSPDALVSCDWAELASYGRSILQE